MTIADIVKKVANGDRVIIEVCVGTACHLMGSPQLVEFLEDLSRHFNHQVEVQFVSCLNRCHDGPCVKINGCLLPNATCETIEEILLQVVDNERRG